MRTSQVVAMIFGMAVVTVCTASAQTGVRPLPALLGDSALSVPLTSPGKHMVVPKQLLPADGRIAFANLSRPAASTVLCPMQITARDSGAQDRMPVQHSDLARVERIPVDRQSCTNPLAAARNR